MKKVLILEDEVNIRSFVVINLKRAGFDVIEAGDGQEALDRIAENPDVGVAILDIMVPGDMDGFEVCRQIRATNKQLGIIMLTARTQEMDKVTGLMTGADDYVTKPFNILELKARVRALLRRSGTGKKKEEIKVIINGAGAAGCAIGRLMLKPCKKMADFIKKAADAAKITAPSSVTSTATSLFISSLFEFFIEFFPIS